MDLRETLDILRAAGVSRAELEYGWEETIDPDGKLHRTGASPRIRSVEFAPEPPGPSPATPFVDKEGKPIDFDADMPPLGRDMVAEANLVKPGS